MGGRFGISTYLHNSDLILGLEITNGTVGFKYTADSNWHNILIVYPANGTGSTSVRVYFDGSLQSSTIMYPVNVLNSANDYIHWIGALGLPPSPLYSFIGSIDDIRLYNRALTDAEIEFLSKEK